MKILMRKIYKNLPKNIGIEFQILEIDRKEINEDEFLFAEKQDYENINFKLAPEIDLLHIQESISKSNLGDEELSDCDKNMINKNKQNNLPVSGYNNNESNEFKSFNLKHKKKPNKINLGYVNIDQDPPERNNNIKSRGFITL